ncbi:dTDP-4-dehydrorhamnose reductase [Maricaulis maris]|nr:dTDP-4-dehydrorhamnose reductase [Maricaulis maris]
MKPVLMFGTTGQVARCVLDSAGNAGLDVTALSRVNVDLADQDAIRAAIMAAPEGSVVVNAAAYTAVDQAESDEASCRAINAVAPTVMAEACHKRGFIFLHISTDYVFDGSKATPYFEGDPTNPQGVYGTTKLEGEAGVREVHDKWVILRTAWVYSRYGKNFLKTMLRLGADRDSLGVVDDQRGCPTHAADIATALITLVDQLRPDDVRFGLYHFCGRGGASWADFADHIFAVQSDRWGRRPDVNRVTSADYPTPAKRPANSMLCSDRFSSAFGFTAPTWTESVQTVVEQLAP